MKYSLVNSKRIVLVNLTLLVAIVYIYLHSLLSPSKDKPTEMIPIVSRCHNQRLGGVLQFSQLEPQLHAGTRTCCTP